MIELLNCDCMDFMRKCSDKAFDLAIVDPPYGIGISNNSFRGKQVVKNWDSAVPNELYFSELMRVSNNQIIWGGNYFNLPASQGFLIWDKVQPHDFSSAMCEYAWMSIQSPAKLFKAHVVTTETNKIHPTQKPVKLYKWILKNYSKQGYTVLDTYGGSFSHAIAAYDLGFDLTIMEIDEDYYKAGKERFDAHVAKYSPATEIAVTKKGELKLF